MYRGAGDLEVGHISGVLHCKSLKSRVSWCVHSLALTSRFLHRPSVLTTPDHPLGPRNQPDIRAAQAWESHLGHECTRATAGPCVTGWGRQGTLSPKRFVLQSQHTLSVKGQVACVRLCGTQVSVTPCHIYQPKQWRNKAYGCVPILLLEARI